LANSGFTVIQKVVFLSGSIRFCPKISEYTTASKHIK